jgi:hypothetical protein
MSLGDLLFASGFDNKDPGIADISNAMTFGTSTPRTSLSTAWMRGNPEAYAMLRSGSTGAAAAVSEVVFGFGFRTSAVGQNYCWRIMSPNGISNTKLIYLGTATGKFAIWRGDDTSLAIGTAVIPADTWCWVWGYIKVHDSAGVIRLKINGVTDIATTGSLDTRSDSGAGGDTVDRIVWGNDSNHNFDDMYVLDATGTTNNGDDIDIGEVTIPYIVPDSAGDTTGMTRGGADSGANWSQVEEIPPNDATDYVEHATSGTLDLYNLTTVAGMGTVKGVAVRNRSKKSAAGSKNMRSLLKSGGTVSNGPDLALSTSWESFVRNLRKNPVTSADFTTGEIDALQIGQEART